MIWRWTVPLKLCTNLKQTTNIFCHTTVCGVFLLYHLVLGSLNTSRVMIVYIRFIATSAFIAVYCQISAQGSLRFYLTSTTLRWVDERTYIILHIFIQTAHLAYVKCLFYCFSEVIYSLWRPPGFFWKEQWGTIWTCSERIWSQDKFSLQDQEGRVYFCLLIHYPAASQILFYWVLSSSV